MTTTNSSRSNRRRKIAQRMIGVAGVAITISTLTPNPASAGGQGDY